MVEHSAFYPLIVPEVIGCPSLTVDSAINRAAAEFCKGSLVWQERLGATLQPGAFRYELDLPMRSVLVAVLSARIDARLLTPVSDPRGEIPWGVATGEPLRFALLPGWREFAVDPTPIEAATLAIEATLTPSLAATSFPDVLADQYVEAIADGAKAILKRIPGQVWTDFAASQFYDGEFKRRTAEARIEREHGAAPSLSVRPRAFG